MSRNVNDQPDPNAFGIFVDEMTTAFGITGAKAIEIFGGTPSGRDWKQIMDDGKSVMKDFPKGT